ncbi:ABC-type transport system involved in multi-copper enzyme maturation permease subunit [Cytobacillus eiseniae]|uniref:ABC-type transport system involved in multi-copper enzyme maturation permease subunit n=1 Tax=Cytobacillus eiseniae TaxID=762947 RepID=A0ABS4R9L1_9BACI|nr:ABC transporter permease [Cytobacillus eiseniae]MBP2239588.1 ABC-type transport system involved in multi-copper enzyme maturation permease subunit [Cytobacillus eiseniae]
MKLLLFEWKKIWRQKKLFWLFCIIFLSTIWIYQQNLSEQSMRGERAAEKVNLYIEETSRIRGELDQLKRENQLAENQEKQLKSVSDMGSTLTLWKVATNNEQWELIPTYEHLFWTHVAEYEQNDGYFTVLQGVEREKAIQKNEWMVANELFYDDEAFPLSPALILKQSTEWLCGLLGIFILLLFFGTTVTSEREQNTWLTLKTQPIPKWKIYGSKYMILLSMLAIFLLLVVSVSLIVPVIIGDYGLNLSYPQIIEIDDQFKIISTFTYLKINLVYFISAIFFTFSIILLFSVWIKNPFNTLTLISTIIFFGFILTDVNAWLQNAFNPFQFYRLPELFSNKAESSEYLYLLSSIFWSSFLLLLSVFLPEKDISFFQGRDIEKPFKQVNTQSTLWKVVQFEWRKIWRKGLMRQGYILLLLIIVFGYFLIFQEAKEKEANYMGNLENMGENHPILPYLRENLASYERMKEGKEEKLHPNMPIDLHIEETNKAISIFEEQVEKAMLAFSAYQESNWIPFYEYQLFENRFTNQDFESGLFINNRIENIGKMAVDASLLEKEWLMEYNIQPVFTGEFVTTIFHYWGEENKKSQEDWEEANKKVDSSGLFTLYLYFQQHFYLIPMILFLLLFGGGMVVEKGKKSSIRMLLTQPVTIKQFFYGKWLTSIMIIWISSLAIIAIILLKGMIFDRFGDWNYPILVYDSASSAYSPDYSGYLSQGMGFHFVSIGSYLMQSVSLFLLVVLFLITLTHFCAIFIHHLFSAFSFVTLLVIGGYGLSTTLFSEQAYLLPFTYLNVSRITNGEIAAVINHSEVNYITGCIVLVISSIIIMVIGNVILTKKRRKVSLKQSFTKEVSS